MGGGRNVSRETYYPFFHPLHSIGEKIYLKPAPENPVLWTGMKGGSAEGRKNLNQVLKQVQHDNGVWLSSFVIPNQVLNLFQDLRFRDLGFGFREFGPVGGVLYFSVNLYLMPFI
jgi:hypothetical protein